MALIKISKEIVKDIQIMKFLKWYFVKMIDLNMADETSESYFVYKDGLPEDNTLIEIYISTSAIQVEVKCLYYNKEDYKTLTGIILADYFDISCYKVFKVD